MLRAIRRRERSGSISKCKTVLSRWKLRTMALESRLRHLGNLRHSDCSACVNAPWFLAVMWKLRDSRERNDGRCAHANWWASP